MLFKAILHKAVRRSLCDIALSLELTDIFWLGGIIMENSVSKRNPVIELLRFAFAMMVVMVHLVCINTKAENYIFRNGYIAVEFFFILSGYFASKSALKPNGDTPAGKWAVQYTVKKYAAFMPAVIISVIICFLVQIYTKTVTWSDFPYAVLEMFLLPQTGIYKFILNGPLWYLSAMLFTMPILVYLIRKKNDFFMHIGSILIPLFIYGCICRTDGHMETWLECGFTELRAFAGLCMGFNAYKLSDIFERYKQHRNKKNDNSYIYIYIYILAAAMIFYIIWYSFSHRHTYMDFMMIFMMTFSAAAIIPADVKISPSSFAYKLCIFLGKLSFYVYCSHWALSTLLPHLFPDKNYYELTAIYVPAAIMLALAVMGLTALMKKLGGRLKRDLPKIEETTT